MNGLGVHNYGFKSALALWLFGLFSAITSSDPIFTFSRFDKISLMRSSASMAGTR